MRYAIIYKTMSTAATAFASIGCLLVLIGFVLVLVCLLINHCKDNFITPSARN